MGWFKSNLGSIVGGFAGGILGGPAGASAGASLGGAVDEERAQQSAYKQQKSDALANWNLQNQYNSPVEQMKRLREAGLNPMLVYGSGNVTGNSSGSIDTPVVPVTGGKIGKAFSNVAGKLALAQQGQDLEATRLLNTGHELDNKYKELRLQLLQKKLDNVGINTNNGNSFNSTYQQLREEKMRIAIAQALKNLNKREHRSITDLNTWTDFGNSIGESIAQGHIYLLEHSTPTYNEKEFWDEIFR